MNSPLPKVGAITTGAIFSSINAVDAAKSAADVKTAADVVASEAASAKNNKNKGGNNDNGAKAKANNNNKGKAKGGKAKKGKGKKAKKD